MQETPWGHKLPHLRNFSAPLAKFDASFTTWCPAAPKMRTRCGEGGQTPQGLTPQYSLCNWFHRVALRRNTMRRIWTTATRLLLSSAFIAAALPAMAWEEDWTVVTISQDGTWGMATADTAGPAIAAAIRNCRAKAPATNDCGAQSRATRRGWIIANLCGDRAIIVAGETREDAELAVRNRETDLRQSYVPALPPCRRIVTVGPGGAQVALISPSVGPHAASPKSR
jgi:hypothetical protein